MTFGGFYFGEYWPQYGQIPFTLPWRKSVLTRAVQPASDNVLAARTSDDASVEG